MSEKSGITVEQYMNLLNNWNEEILSKQQKLTTGFRVYKICAVLTVCITAVFSVFISVISSYNLHTNSNSSYTMIIVTNILILVFSLITAFLTAADGFFRFNSTSDKCSTTAKAYAELYREIEVSIREASNSVSSSNMITSDNLFSKALYYSTKEQLILQMEPGMIFIGHGRRSVFEDVVLRNNPLNAKDYNYLSEYVMHLPENSDKRVLEKLLQKLYIGINDGIVQVDHNEHLVAQPREYIDSESASDEMLQI